ncbi:hypothetical protein [Streptomyces clavuligerus]|uniref:hypothetical protein n=1 Tax=Streptomyces clavuligerus TaxID=1901 RepID=UPI0001800769|nr:hypothetical protein [Streptomyces clavuligerus]ANW22637.1 hypothetical protein BB341_30505 [Streptomyces clavuligerus]AXU16894.1 hypothetical protein D1794_29480 [Streptomyces clavuligerus]AXU17496.1 hypothetical protein D1794_33675 [Streptomyces clavuligerus]EDY52622.1 conserved hypothetical protein [Streptomyces clavuligerus]MBY6301029.1 hypothetical protein [Streptomyces clavuligerus]
MSDHLTAFWTAPLTTPTREPRRPFDTAAGLRRLAEDAGYVRSPTECGCARARRKLAALAGWGLTQTGAATHVKILTELIGSTPDSSAPGDFAGWTDSVDIDGVHVLACSLYLAHHPESACFWWQLAAGAGHSGAAYCLHLHHLSYGEFAEAGFWKLELSSLLEHEDGDSPEDFIKVLESFARYAASNPRTTVPTGSLEAEFERLADRQENDGLVCRPDHQLVDRIHGLAAKH